MIMLKKTGALVLSCALLVGALAGCGKKQVDPIQEAFGYSKDTVFATINGDKITAGDYLPWLSSGIAQVEQTYESLKEMGLGEMPWDQDVGGGTTMKVYMKEQALETAKLFWAVKSIAKEEGAKLSAEDKKTYEQNRADMVESIGGEEMYAAYLKTMCLVEDKMMELNTLDMLSIAVEEKLCGEGKRFHASDEAVRAYMDELGILKAKHILFLTKDPSVDGPAYPAEQIAAQKQKADETLAALRTAEDPVALFDTLMNERSEDAGLEGNPDGYLFSTKPDGKDFTSSMVKEFEEGTAALEFDKISEVITSEYGYHIILRQDPLADEAVKDKYVSKWYGVQVDALYQERINTAEIKTTEAYDSLDAKAFYETLTAYGKLQQEAALPKSEGEDETQDEAPQPPATGGDTPPEGEDAQANTDENADAGADTGANADANTDANADTGADANVESTQPSEQPAQ